MEKIINSLLVLGSLLIFIGCHEITSEDPSVLTYYAAFEMLGDETMVIPVGTSFNDPGVKATIKDQDVSNRIVITGMVDANAVGLYTLIYSVTNDDGFTTSVKRTVIVEDPNITTDISGSYVTVEGTYRDLNGATDNYPGFDVTITKVASGFFYVSDLLGGYYDQGRQYGANYAATGYIRLMEDNSIVLISSFVKGWGDSLSGLYNGKYNPNDNSIKWDADYAEMMFYVVLNKK